MKTQILFFLLLVTKAILAQNVGINNNNPQAALDVNGDFRYRTKVLSGLSAQNYAVDVNTNKAGIYTMPSLSNNLFAEFYGFSPGVDGRVFTLVNTLNFDITIGTEPIAPANNQIIGAGGRIAPGGGITFMYSTAKNKWVIISKAGDPNADTWYTNDYFGTTRLKNTNGRVGIGLENGIDPDPSAKVEIAATDKGFLMPRNADPTANIASPAAGLIAYNTTTNSPNFFNGTQWQSVSGTLGFKNMKVFNGVGLQTWTIPAGINKIMLEGWGGGGGGVKYNNNGGTLIGNGAGAGGYTMNILDVMPGDVLDIIVGIGGTGESLNTIGLDGGLTTVKIGNNYIFSCLGGRKDGLSGLVSIQGIGANIIGENGSNLQIDYGNSSATSYNLIVKLGDGGSAHNGGRGGKGGFFVSANSSSLLYTSSNESPINRGGKPGGGGGAGYTAGGDGGEGMLIIYY